MGRKSTYDLPGDYLLIETLDLLKGRNQVRLNLAALAIMFLTLALFVLFLPDMLSFSFPLLSFLVVYILYIIAHELTHGAAIRLLTGAKVNYAFHGVAASAGNPDVYFSRGHYVVIALAPFMVWSLVGMLLFKMLPKDVHLGFAVLFAVHLGGCVGDYVCAWKAYRYKGCFVQDEGTKMAFYVKQKASR